MLSDLLWNGLGLAYSALNKVDDAIEAFTQAARIDSHEAKAWENLGVAYTHKGNAVKALDAFKRASFLNPADTNVLKKIGLVYASIGQQDGVAVVHKMLLQHSASVASDFMKQATALLKDRQNTK